MRVIDKDLLTAFREKNQCEWCGIQSHDGMDPAHIFSRGAGQIDISLNLLALCRECHSRSHAGGDPNKAQMLAVAAAREGTTPDEIEDLVYALRRDRRMKVWDVMEQGSLFSGTDAYGSPIVKAPHVAGSPTSQAAAEAIQPHLNELQLRVLTFMRQHGMDGLTDEEGTDALCMSPSTYRPRRVELVAAGLVADSGKTRKTKANRPAVVWVAIQAG